MELHGRRAIYTNVPDINDGNILEVLADALPTFTKNKTEAKHLYKMYRGEQDIRYKVKETRPEINHKICENRAYAITDFKTGYICGDPIVYTSRSKDEAIANQVADLNSVMLDIGKAASDKDLFDWMHNCGVGYRLVLPDTANLVSMSVISPMQAFVIRSSDYTHRPMAGVYVTTDADNNIVYSVYTDNRFYEVVNNEIIRAEDHILGMVPLFEYPLNEARLGAWEPAENLLNAINYLDSDRLDGVTSFINSLCVLYNAELPEGEDGNSIREQGLICLKSVGENKADIKIMAEQLDQNAAQTLKEDLYNAVLQIVGMPNQSDNADSSNNGAIFLKQGYQLAETRAKGEEVAYKRVNKAETALILSILSAKIGMTLRNFDVDITFTRRAYSDIISKATVFATLIGSKACAPLDAWVISGLTTDPEAACKRALEYMRELEAANEEESATA